MKLAVPLLMVILLSGCGKDSTQRLAFLESTVKATDSQIADANSTLNQLKSEWLTLRTALADPNNGSAQMQALGAQMARVQAQLIPVVSKFKSLQSQKTSYVSELDALVKSGNVTPEQEFKEYGKGVTQIGGVLPPPFNTLAGIIGGIILPGVGAIAGSIVRGRKAKADAQIQQDKTDMAVGGIVGSVSKLLGTLPESRAPGDTTGQLTQDEAKNILAREQVKVPGAAAAVRQALDGKSS
jgi:uncharacterized coiled-coil protein SlyX